MNTLLKSGILPNDWKTAKLIPIYKSGPKENCTNYRLISVLPSFSKVIEKFVLNEISNYLSVNNILNKLQFGLKKSNSTTDALLYMKDQIIIAQNQSNYCAVISLDLEKAFASVPPDLLMTELFTLGFDDIVFQWFNSYFSNRT
jgi:potassium voltage-gated channel Eag-related subfamily H protein 8